MSIDLDIFRRAGVDNEKDERAQRAVKAFRALQPTLSAYARILTKNPAISVEMAARDNGSTDGKRIYFRPPIALGDATLHERRLCDKRDSDKQLLCIACAIRESVLTTIYHEIAHICFDSFEKTSDADKGALVAKAVKEAGGKYAEAIAARINGMPSWRKDSYIAMASLVSQFLPIIVNALEDARVNRELFKARRGVKVMFDADMHKVFTEGVEQKDESGQVVVKKWNEYPLNLQAIVGVFTKASGYDYSNWFVEQVVTALDDPALTELVKKIDTANSAADVYHLSFPVLSRLRELGFCKLDTDPEVEEEPDDSEEPETQSKSSEENTGEEDGTESGETTKESTDDSGSHSESDDSTGTSEDATSESEDSGHGSEGEPSDGNEEGSGSEETDKEASGDGKDEADAEAGNSSGDDQSSSPDDTEVRQDGSEDDSGDEGDDGEAGNGTNPGEEGSADDSAGQSGDEGDNDASGGSKEHGTENGGEGSEGGSDLGEDSEGASEGDSESDESEATSGDESDGHSSDSTGSDDSTDSISGKNHGSVDSDDHLDTTEQKDDLSTGQEAGTEDVDLADSEDRDGSIPPEHGGADLEGVSDAPKEEEASDGNDESDEPIDTGADDGTGGTTLIENKKNDHLPMGTPEECKYALLKWGDHEEKPKSIEEGTSQNAVDRAIIQGIYFETPSRRILGVRFHRYGEPVMVDGNNMSKAWDHKRQRGLGSVGVAGDFNPSEVVLGPALLRMRVAFADNQRGKESRGRKSGKVDARVLGRRAPHGDDRLFKKKTLPGKKDYFVVIGVDVSGSTVGVNIALEKRAVMAQAQLLTRMGIPFAIYAHSGNYDDPYSGRSEGLDLDIYVIKEEHDIWDTKIKERLENLGPDSANLDGHALEFLRKRLDESNATDKIIMYYSDGKMPAENHDEELVILQREIKTCKKKGYTVMGVGIRTDSPARHGLPTVQVDGDEDIVKVVKHLEGALR